MWAAISSDVLRFRFRRGSQLGLNTARSHRIAGRTFAAIALLAAAALLQLAGATWAVAGGLALFLAGLPHGAFASDSRLLVTRRGYAARYIAAGLIAGAAFLMAPVLLLAVFLALSAWHFLHESGAGHPVRRMALAGLAVGGSAFARPDETQAIFSALCAAPIDDALMVGLAIIGAAGLVAAAIVLVRQPRDAGLWVMAISPFLLHPVLATGIIFMLGHAGPVTAKIMRRRGWRWPSAIGLGAASSLVAVGAVLALPVTAGLLPYLAAAALAIIVPHLLPASWFLEAAIPQPHGPGQRTQAATSPAT